MERKRVRGRFAPEGESGKSPDKTADEPGQPAARDRRLIRKARKRLVDAMPTVAEKLVTKANEGSVTHMKLLLQLLGLEDGGLTPNLPPPKEKSLKELLAERLSRPL